MALQEIGILKILEHHPPAIEERALAVTNEENKGLLKSEQPPSTGSRGQAGMAEKCIILVLHSPYFLWKYPLSKSKLLAIKLDHSYVSS